MPWRGNEWPDDVEWADIPSADQHQDEFDDEYEEQQPKGDPNRPDYSGYGAWVDENGNLIEQHPEDERRQEPPAPELEEDRGLLGRILRRAGDWGSTKMAPPQGSS